VWRDRIIRHLAAIAFIGFGIFVALTTWLQALLHPAGISSATAGWLLVVMVLTGVIGAAVLPAPIARAGAAQTLFRVTAAVTGGVCVMLALWQWVPAIALGVGLAGFLLLASLPVILELAERRAGPAGTSATALIWLAGNAGGIVIALLVQAVVHHRLIAFLLMAAIAASVIPFVRSSD
jgi:cyanate permease